ncbi:Hpt domain-containing protein, partial [Myxococcus sp. K15C18031901]|uniref:Hpt domain-containing protein n=1 Tax=Myxococcus dinghuensis TaxID=2906761 RepID=UPI0020A7B53C
MDTEALKKSLLKKFQEVTADRLQKIQLGVLDLEKETADQAADDVARELHTMKGEARMLGLAAIGQLAHAAEDVLRAEREGRTATEIATDVMLRACDVLSDLIEDLSGANTGTPASEDMVRALAEVSGQPAPAIPGARPAPPKPAVAAPVAPAPAPVAEPVAPVAAPRPP